MIKGKKPKALTTNPIVITFLAPNLSSIKPSTGPNKAVSALANALAPEIKVLLQLYLDSKALRKKPVPCIPVRLDSAIMKLPYNAIIHP